MPFRAPASGRLVSERVPVGAGTTGTRSSGCLDCAHLARPGSRGDTDGHEPCPRSTRPTVCAIALIGGRRGESPRNSVTVPARPWRGLESLFRF